ncbi:hypothetical protein [Spirochaeta lutea]|uniref:Uncharacterized protein n=1 Tax=Spirochaeta lutea TaxID=1480694 RepID=A0A098QWQ4_9SPIO|nr:hypothetical protein [Spirochaeta lutea]KGE72159.1 hypothetical protein DC28_07630 [Spirochaeta lutea]
MKAKVLILLSAALVLLASCGGLMTDPETLLPQASITSYEVLSENLTATGGTVKVKVVGSTFGEAVGEETDYTGTLGLYDADELDGLVYGQPDYLALVGETVTVEGDFTVELVVDFSGYGNYNVLLMLVDSEGNEAESEEFSLRFYPDFLPEDYEPDSLPLQHNPSEDDINTRSSEAAQWYSLKMVGDDAEYGVVVHWGDSKKYSDHYDATVPTADVQVSIYDYTGAAIAENVDSGWWDSAYPDDESASTYGGDDGILLEAGVDYEVGETLFLKVTGTTGTYEFYNYAFGYAFK